MQNLDFGLILLKPESSDTVYPSKLSAHLAYNHPLVLISDQKNIIHDFILKNKIGLSINIYEKNLNTISNLFDINMVNMMKHNVSICFEKEFSSNNFARKLIKIIN